MPTQFPATIELSTLNGENGFILNGITTGDHSGRSVAAAGDVNGDSVADFIIGSVYASPHGVHSGQSYVVFGGTQVGNSGLLELSSLNGSNGFKINGIAAGDLSSYSIASAGDVNVDGLDDLILGAHAAANGPYSGQTYVIFGSASLGTSGTIELSSLNGSNGFKINGIAALDESGNAVASAGDVNNDGKVDLIIGAMNADPHGSASGQSYIIFGGSGVGSSGVVELSNLNGANGFKINGISGFDHSGWSVASAGDINDDGVDDVIVGAPMSSSTGRSHVIFGGTGVGSSGTIELSDIDGSNGFSINGINSGDRCGNSVSAAGDVNSDGIPDIVIGAFFASPNGVNSGQSYVVFGGIGIGNSGALELSDLDGSNGFIINGISANDISGISIASAGDINGDGINDVIIGAYAADPFGNSALGQSYVLFGGADMGSSGIFQLSSLNGDNGFLLNGIRTYDYSGRAVASAGDVDNDGIADLIIGADSADPHGLYSGQSYVVFGDATPPTILRQHLTVVQGAVITVTNNLFALNITRPQQLTIPYYHVVNPVRCQFEYSNNPSVAILRFSQDDINQNKVVFKQDGSTAAPSFSLHIYKGFYQSNPISGNITFTAYPELINNNLVITEGQNLTLSSVELSAVDPVKPASGLIFSVTSLIHGRFESSDNPGQAITQFFQNSVTQNKIRFIHDGSNDSPNYRISVSNGDLQTTPNFALISFTPVNDAPQLTVNNFELNPEGGTIITGTNLQAVDEETTAANLRFIITNITHGHFERTINSGIVIDQFEQSEVNTAAIKFFIDTGSELPSFNLALSDGILETDPTAAAISLAKLQSQTTVINNIGTNNTIRNAIIGSTVSGAIGILFLLVKLYIKRKSDNKVARALEGDAESASDQRALFFKNVVSPIAKKIFSALSIKNFFGVTDNVLQEFLDATTNLVQACQALQVPVNDIPTMDPAEATLLINEIARQTKQVLAPSTSLIGYAKYFFVRRIMPQQLENASAMIASLVATAWVTKEGRVENQDDAEEIKVPRGRVGKIHPAAEISVGGVAAASAEAANISILLERIDALTDSNAKLQKEFDSFKSKRRN